MFEPRPAGGASAGADDLTDVIMRDTAPWGSTILEEEGAHEPRSA
jgi:hypothetical protein